MHRYAAAFARHGLRVGQVLLTAEDVVRRAHYRNAHRTLARLLALGVVPVVNENDAVATAEIRFGDNDRLAALVAHLVGADALVLLSDVDGLYDGDPRRPGARRLVPEVRGDGDLTGVTAGGTGRPGSAPAGWPRKVDAARVATGAGIPVAPGRGRRRSAARSPASRSARCSPPPAPARTARLLWLRARRHPARPAACSTPARSPPSSSAGSSLLPAGVTGVDGDFAAGDPVELVDQDGVRSPAAWSATTRPSCPTCWAARRASWPARGRTPGRSGADRPLRRPVAGPAQSFGRLRQPASQRGSHQLRSPEQRHHRRQQHRRGPASRPAAPRRPARPPAASSRSWRQRGEDREHRHHHHAPRW